MIAFSLPLIVLTLAGASQAQDELDESDSDSASWGSSTWGGGQQNML